MGYEIKQRKFDGRWCIYSSKFNIVIAEFVDGIPQVTIDEICRHLTSRSSRAATACAESKSCLNAKAGCSIPCLWHKPPPA